MAVHNLSVLLKVWRYEGRRPKPSEFLDLLVIDPSDSVKKRKGPGDPRADLLLIERSEFSEAEEPSEAFVEELESRLTQTAAWLEKQPVKLFQGLRNTGFTTELLFLAWIDCDQLDLALPADFLKACGKLGLRISVVTND